MSIRTLCRVVSIAAVLLIAPFCLIGSDDGGPAQNVSAWTGSTHNKITTEICDSLSWVDPAYHDTLYDASDDPDDDALLLPILWPYHYDGGAATAVRTYSDNAIAHLAMQEFEDGYYDLGYGSHFLMDLGNPYHGNLDFLGLLNHNAFEYIVDGMWYDLDLGSSCANPVIANYLEVNPDKDVRDMALYLASLVAPYKVVFDEFLDFVPDPFNPFDPYDPPESADEFIQGIRDCLELTSSYVAALYKHVLPYMEVTSPNGGENWPISTTQTITWAYDNNPGSYVKIELYKGTALSRTIASSTACDGSYSWSVPTDLAVASDYRIKVSSTSGPACDYSDAYFTICYPTITVLDPNGGEYWEMGTAHDIWWSYNGGSGSYVKIDLYKGGTLSRTLVSSTLCDGLYSWSIPTDLTIGTDYKVRISSTSLPVYDYSDNYFTITKNPVITVTSPNGGEDWPMASTQVVTWTYANYPGSTVKIELYRGTTFVRTLTSSTSCDGTWGFIVPADLTVASDYRVKVSSTSTSANDFSDAYFTISAQPPTIIVTSPDGSMGWQSGSTHDITWTSVNNPGAYVKIELCWDDDPMIPIQVVSSSTANDGLYTWTIPTNIAPTGPWNFMIRISSTSSPAVGVSYQFAITSYQSLTVLSPNGGEIIDSGDQARIVWFPAESAGSRVNIDLYKGTSLYRNLAYSISNGGVFSCYLGASGDDLRVKISSTTTGEYDFSDAYFTATMFASPAVYVLSPSGGESYAAGSGCLIKWNYFNDLGGYVKIELYRSTTLVSTITSSTSCSSGAYYWTIPVGQTLASDYNIKVSSTSTPAYDFSNGYFSVVAPLPTVTVTSPNGGESWEAGSSHTISWTSANSPGSYVKIELYRNLAVALTITSSTANDGSHSWAIPVGQLAAGGYSIKITSTTLSYAFDFSDDYFDITPSTAPMITVTSPNGGEMWTMGTYHTITWTYANNPGSYVKIELYKGTSVALTITSSTANDGSHGWTIPTTLKRGEDYRVKVTSTTLTSVYDYSNSYFTIKKPTGGGGGGSVPSPKDSALLAVESEPSITISSPNGGETWLMGTVQAITWTYANDPGSYVKIELYRNSTLVFTVVSSTMCDGSYLWTIPTSLTSASDYRIRISSTMTAANDYSDAYFMIVGDPEITVTSPNGGEVWTMGTYHTISWTSANSPGSYVKIELYKGSTVVLTISSSTLNDGSCGWTIPTTLKKGDDYRVKVSSTTTAAYDYSDSYFTLKKPAGGGPKDMGVADLSVLESVELADLQRSLALADETKEVAVIAPTELG